MHSSRVTPEIVARQSLPLGNAEVVEWRWPSPMDVIARESAHMIEMSLPPYATDGTACFPEFEGGQQFRYMGSLFVRPAGVLVRSRSAGGRIRVVRLAVKPAVWSEIYGKEIRADEQLLLTALDCRDERLRMLMHRIRDELMEPGFASAALIDSYAHALIIEAARWLDRTPPGRGSYARLADWQYRKVRERIEDGDDLPTVAELASLCGVSERHFRRLYKALTGEPVVEHLARVQHGRAMTLLRNTDLPLKQVAQRVGFSHSSSFATAFRRATGSTPQHFRQRHRAS